MAVSRCARCKKLSRQGRRKHRKLKMLFPPTQASLMRQGQSRALLSRSVEKGDSDGAIKVAQVALYLGEPSLSLSAAPVHAANARILAGAGAGGILQRTLLSLFHSLPHYPPRGLSDQRRRPGYYGSGCLEYPAWPGTPSNYLQYAA